MSKRKRNTMILAGIALVLILFIGINVALAAPLRKRGCSMPNATD